jgi:hypothetical protein
MRSTGWAVLVFLAAACAPPVRVETTATPAPPVVLNVTNTLGTPVNVYIVGEDSTAMLLGQVGSNASRELSIRSRHPGDHVILRAIRVDGSTAYTRSDFTLAQRSEWRVP